MTRKVKWGIIGAGGIARRRTLPAIGEVSNAEIIGIMDKSKEALEEMAKEYNIPYVYENEEDLINNPEIEAIYIASPVGFHKEQARKVIASGKHILLEKPIGLDLEESKEIVTLAKNADIKAGAALVMRFHDGHQKMRDLVQEGKLGQIVSARAQLTCWFPKMENNWRQNIKTAGGGSLLDMGIHCIDLLRYILADEVEEVCGFIDNKIFDYEVEDSATIIMKMKKGVVCTIDNYFNIPDEAAKCLFEIYGTKGSIIATRTIGQDGGGAIELVLSGDDKGYQSQQERENATDDAKLDFEKCNMYARQIESFSDAILKDKQPEISLMEAYKDMEVIEYSYLSAKQKKVLKIGQ